MARRDRTSIGADVQNVSVDLVKDPSDADVPGRERKMETHL
jgi:hypothetical protein